MRVIRPWGDATLRNGHWNLDQAIWPTIVSCYMQLIICCLQFQAECEGKRERSYSIQLSPNVPGIARGK
jgi:hypothetical protein